MSQTKKFEMDRYLGVFPLNDPDLTVPVIYARHLGFERDRELMKHFPGRKAYWFDASRTLEDLEFIPLDEAATQPAGRRETAKAE